MNARQNLGTAGDAADHLAEIADLRARLDRLETTALGRLALPGAALNRRVWVDRVADLVAVEFGMATADLRGSRREARFTRPRFVWVWLVKHIGNLSNPQCAQSCQYVDHTSVIHACRRVDGWRETQPDFRTVTDMLLQIGRRLRCPPAEAPPDQLVTEPAQ